MMLGVTTLLSFVLFLFQFFFFLGGGGGGGGGVFEQIYQQQVVTAIIISMPLILCISFQPGDSLDSQ